MVFRSNLCGLACIGITYSCICYVDYAVTVHMIGGSMSYSVWGVMNIVFFNIILGLMALSHVRAMTCDPGMVSTLHNNHPDFSLIQTDKYKQQEGSNAWTICSKCEAVRPPRAHHCRICGRCIRKMDHHCPWINNCIGEQNQKYLLMFLFYVVLTSFYTLMMVATYWWLHAPNLSAITMQTKWLHTSVLVSMAVLFSVFSVAVAMDQFNAVRSHSEAEEKHKGERQITVMPFKDICYEVFGRTHPMLWLVPLNLNRRRSGARQALLES